HAVASAAARRGTATKNPTTGTGLEIATQPAPAAAAARPIQTPNTPASAILAARETSMKVINVLTTSTIKAAVTTVPMKSSMRLPHSRRPRRRPTGEDCGLFQRRSAKDVQDHLLAVHLAPGREEAMPYAPEHKRDTREKILESARRLFNRKGYSGVSIEEIMSHAGLTHGGFYRHFSGKDELYAAAVRQFLCKKTPAPWQKPRKPSAVTRPRAQRIVDA